MFKNPINPPASMIFDRTKLAAAGAWPRLCNYRSNLVVGDFGLRLPDQVLAIVTGVRPRSASQVSSGRSMRPTTVDRKMPGSSMGSSFNVHFIGNISIQNSPEEIDHISIYPQLLSGLQCYATRMSGALCCQMLFCLLQADTQMSG
jgi:hypothetical protein